MLHLQKTLTLIGLLLFCLTSAVGAEAKQIFAPSDGIPLSALNRQHLLSDNFILVKTVPELPRSVQSQVTKPRETERPNLPLRRMILAGTSAGYCFVYARYGGFGNYSDLSLYRLSDKSATLIWRGFIPGLDQASMTKPDLPHLRDAISKGKFTNANLPEQPQSSN